MWEKYWLAIALGVVMLASLGLHVYLIKTLNVVEDESAYMMDAWQISPNVLPFREFGATKGPVFLFLLKGWQMIGGQTIQGSRLFTSLLHVASIPLLYLFVEAITRKRFTAYIAAALWAIIPAAVSLTTNVIHAPLELVWILTSAVFLTSGSHPAKPWRSGVAALFFFLAVLTRISAVAFLPLMMLLIFWKPAGIPSFTDSGDLARGAPARRSLGEGGGISKLKVLATFCLTGILLLAATVVIIYPLYGWPKTAFFFNVEAAFIASDVRAAYQSEIPSGPIMLFRGLLPLWYEGFPLILLALALPVLSIRAITFPLRLVITGVLILIAFYSYQPLFANLSNYWSEANLTAFEQSARAIFIILTSLTALALLLPVPRTHWRRQIFTFTIIFVWMASFIGTYRFWGRNPTPFYILESIPAFCIAAALAVQYIASRSRLLAGITLIIIATSFIAPYTAIPQKQYRGTVATDAAIAAGKAIEEHVQEGEAIFTAQPVYPFLGKRPLYKYLTHPGWYLAERAGIVPPNIRRTFFPDMEDLTKDVTREVNWIMVDWRTNDVYFNEDVAETQGLRDLLANEFAPAAEIPNDVTEPIILYKRK